MNISWGGGGQQNFYEECAQTIVYTVNKILLDSNLVLDSNAVFEDILNPS